MAAHRDLMKKIRKDLPTGAMKPQPWRGLRAVFLIAGIAAGSWALMSYSVPWYVGVVAGVALGNVYGMLAFLGHETLHGSIFKSRWAQDLIGYPAFWLYGFTPALWRPWHNHIHHANANTPDIDPDSYGTSKRFEKVPLARFQFKTSIGSGHFLSIFFFFYRFAYHAQIVLWLVSAKYPKEFTTLNRPRAAIESLLSIASWVAFGVWAGLPSALYVIVIPMATANAILVSYVATNHFLRPLSDVDEPVDNSMSLTVPKIVDFLHMNFSHHVEHHYFPSMSSRFTPVVRNSLLKHAPDRYLAPSHVRAILWLYKTPRLYKDHQTLMNPFTGKTVKISVVEAALRRPSRRSTKQPVVQSSTFQRQ